MARYGAKIAEALDDYRMVPERFIDARDDHVLVFSREGGRYRRLGNPIGTIVLLQHFMGNYDPAITDALAKGREVILTDNVGVGLRTGAAPETVGGIARNATSAIHGVEAKLDELRLEGRLDIGVIERKGHLEVIAVGGLEPEFRA